MKKLLIATPLLMVIVSSVAAIVLSFYRYNYKLPASSEQFETTGLSLTDLEVTQGDMCYYNSVFYGEYFRIYCTNDSSPLSDVNIVVATKDGVKEVHYDYIPPNETFNFLVIARNSKNVSIRTEYSKCKELNKIDKNILGAMKVFYRDGDYLGTSYDVIPKYDEFYYLEDK